MYNVVQGKNLRLDQHSAEVIDDDAHNPFRIPVFDVGGNISWKGCFVDPCTALAALKTHCDKKHLREEKQKELVDIFSSSIFRKDQQDPATKDLHLTVTAAPSPTLLKLFGGALSYEEYRKRYDELGLMDKVFSQKVPEHEGNSKEVTGTTEREGSHPPTCWNFCLVPHNGKLNNDYVASLPQQSTVVPRNLYSCISWMQDMWAAINNNSNPATKEETPSTTATTTKTKGSCASSDSFAIIIHGDKKNVFALGDPVTWNDGPFNNLASNMLGRKQVFGDALYISKNPIAYPKKRKNSKSKKAQDELAPPSTSTPTSTSTSTAPAPAPVPAAPKKKQHKDKGQQLPNKRVKKVKALPTNI
jgi:hypothetical protein